MAWPEYDAKQHKEQGDAYLDWLKSWNVDVSQASKAAPEPVSEPEPVAEPVAEPATEPDDYDDWTNDELRDELGKRELSKSGNKDELIGRLREDDA